MTSLNNQELKEKIAGIYDNPEDPEYCLEDLISEKAMNQLLTLFESELANRERVARIDELRKIRIKQFDSSQGDYELGWNELRHELRCHIKDRLAQLKNNTTKQEDTKDE